MTVGRAIYIDNTNVVTLNALQNSLTSAYVNDATVTVTIVDSNDQAVDGETFPVSMSYVADSDGQYRASLSHELILTEDDYYFAVITAEAGDGSQASWKEPLIAQYRELQNQNKPFLKF